MRQRLIVLLLLLCCCIPPAVAQPGGQVEELEPIVVSGVQPGPGLWEVRRDGHVLWVLGVLSPVPKDIEWQTAEVAQRIGESRQVLDMPSAVFDADVGFFGRIALVGRAIDQQHQRIAERASASGLGQQLLQRDRIAAGGRRNERRS